MVRSIEGLENKWERSFQDASVEASQNYNDGIDGVAETIIAAKADIIAAFTAALNDPSYDAALRAGLTQEVAGAAYGQVMDNIRTTGFVDTVKTRVGTMFTLRRYLATLIPQVRALATGAAGKLDFAAGTPDSIKNVIINTGLMRNSEKMSTATTAAQAEAILIADVDNIDGLSVA